MADTKERHGSLPGCVRLKVEPWAEMLSVIYFGTQGALLSAGCLTRSMLTIRKKYSRGDARGLHDEFGERFNLHSGATKAMPGRMKLMRRVSLQRAMELPGVRELFPDGIPKPVQFERKRSDSSSYTWEQFVQDWKQLSDYDKGIARVRIKRIVGDSKRQRLRNTRPSYLRLVVDNTKEKEHG